LKTKQKKSLYLFVWKWSLWQNFDKERTNQNGQIFLKTTVSNWNSVETMSCHLRLWFNDFVTQSKK